MTSGSWVSVKARMPEDENPCFVATIINELPSTHPVLAVWNGKEWVDANGDVVFGVVFWMIAPTPNARLLRAVKQIEQCLENEHCEETNCCYFAHPQDMTEVLKYIKKQEELE